VILLGILAAAGGAVAATDSYDLLETEILTSTQASVTFSELGSYSDYKHLQIRMVAGTTSAYYTDTFNLQMNNVTSASYSWHRLYGYGLTPAVVSNAGASQNSILAGSFAGSSSAGFGPAVIDVLDPFESNKNTTIRALSGSIDSGEPIVSLNSGAYYSVDSITSIKLLPDSGNFVTGSRFSLYGLKAGA